MENSPNNLDSMTSRQLSDLRKTLEKARDDKLVELKQVETGLKAVIERPKRVQSAYHATLQREEAWSRGKRGKYADSKDTSRNACMGCRRNFTIV
jgi:hypothetical protein